MNLINFYQFDDNKPHIRINDRYVIGQGLVNTIDRHIIGNTCNKYMMTTDKNDIIVFKEKYIVEWTIACKSEDGEIFTDYFTFVALGKLNGHYIRFNQYSHYDFKTLIRYDTDQCYQITDIKIVNDHPEKISTVTFFNCYDFCDHMDIIEKNISDKLKSIRDKKFLFLNPKKYYFDQYTGTKLNFNDFIKSVDVHNEYYLVTDDDSNIVIPVKIQKCSDMIECCIIGHENIIINMSIYENDDDGSYKLFGMMVEIDVKQCDDNEISELLNGCHFVDVWQYKN